MLIEVLIALALFALSAVYLVEGAFVASRTIRFMKDARELEQDLLWVRSQVFQEEDYEKLSEGGDLPTISMGDVQWETEVEMTSVTDLYKVSLTLAYDGNEELNVEAGERIYHMLMLRPPGRDILTLVQTARDFGRRGRSLLPNLKQSARETDEQFKRGFTMVEVLLALSIGSLVLISATSLLMTISQAWANRPATRDAFDAHGMVSLNF